MKNTALWDECSSKVPETLLSWGGELVFRGKQVAALPGKNLYSDIVIINFPSLAALNGWFALAAYQALIPLRQQAAEMVWLAYEG